MRGAGSMSPNNTWPQTDTFTPRQLSRWRIPLGYGCIMSLPEGAAGFTTIELKANFLGTTLEGGVTCEARMLHGGRTTQVWDAEVKSETSGKTIALFRCTQMLLSKTRGSQ